LYFKSATKVSSGSSLILVHYRYIQFVENQTAITMLAICTSLECGAQLHCKKTGMLIYSEGYSELHAVSVRECK